MSRFSLGPENKERVQDTVLAATPGLVLFLMIPLAVFLPNQEEFAHQIRSLLPFGLAFGVWVLVCVGLGLLPGRLRIRIAVGLFFLGLFFLLSDVITPLQMGAIIEDPKGTKIPEPLAFSVLQMLIGLGFALAAWKVPAKTTRVAGVRVVLALLVVQLLQAGVGIEAKSWKASEPGELVGEPVASGGNIYHLVLDAYAAYAFLPTVEREDVRTEFTGFTFFENTITNYTNTHLSIPSFMSGTRFNPARPLRDWITEWKRTGITARARKAGYRVSVYLASDELGPLEFDWQRTGAETSGPAGALQNSVRLADFWLLRSAPTFLKNEVFAKGQGLFTRRFPDAAAGSNKTYLSKLLFDALLADEKLRSSHGEYVYAHLLLPHWPLTLDENCKLKRKVTYESQSACATRIITELIRELRKRGRLAESTILVQADHGAWFAKPRDPSLYTIDQSARSGLLKDGAGILGSGETGARQFESKVRSLLLVKPTRAKNEPLRISTRPTQLLEVAPTLAKLHGWDATGYELGDVFRPPQGKDRRIHIAIGYHQPLGNGKRRSMGPEMQRGTFNHYTFDPAPRIWKKEPDFEVRW